MHWDPQYDRVIPRDLFNEGILLTSLGFLSLAIHNHKDQVNEILRLDHGNDYTYGFEVRLRDSGFLYVENLKCQIIEYKQQNEGEVELSIAQNTRTSEPLQFEFRDFCGFVFEGKQFSKEFKELMETLRQEKLQAELSSVIKELLPSIAKDTQLPVHLDHCFGRIVYDNLFQDCWWNHISKPKSAIASLNVEQLRKAVVIARSLTDLETCRVLNNKSLQWREEYRVMTGKTKR